jgi:hypothetical protein
VIGGYMVATFVIGVAAGVSGRVAYYCMSRAWQSSFKTPFARALDFAEKSALSLIRLAFKSLRVLAGLSKKNLQKSNRGIGYYTCLLLSVKNFLISHQPIQGVCRPK